MSSIVNSLLSFFHTGPLPVNEMRGHYNYFLVALSYIDATLTSFVALEIATYLKTGRSKNRTWPLVAGGVTMGSGIFSMHFIGMLALIMPMQMGYGLGLTALSLIVAISASGYALFIVCRPQVSLFRLVAAGVIIGIAIAGMHYIGMTAMIGVSISYLPIYFSLSLLIAVIAGMASLWMMLNSNQGTQLRQYTFKAISSLIMGAAICGMHYMGMAAAVIVPEDAETMQRVYTFSPVNLSFLIASLTSLILVIGLYIIGRHYPIFVKLGLAFLIIIFMMVPLAYTSLENLASMADSFKTITKQAFPKIVALLEIKANVIRLDAIAEGLGRKESVDEFELKENQLLDALNELEMFENSYRKNSSSNGEAIKELQSLKSSVISVSRELLASHKKGLSHTELSPIIDRLEEAQGKLSTFVKDEIKIESRNLDTLQKNVTRFRRQAYIMTITVIIVIFFIALFLSLLISHRISKPIVELSGMSEEIAKGHLDKRVRFSSEDEIGKLGQSFNTMASELEEANKRRNEFVGMAAHDLRIPLFVIGEGSNLLRAQSLGSLNPKQLRLSEMIFSASASMMSLLDELLAVNPVRSQTIQIKPKRVDLPKFVEEIYSFNQLMAEKKHIFLKVTDNIKETTAYFDQNKIAQVINNFISNAIKFSPINSRIELVIERLGDDLRVEVKDEAAGIPEDEQSKVFSWFAKISVKPTAGEASHGLGLAICKELIEAHQGNIGFTSQVGKGSTFFFEIKAFGPDLISKITTP